MQRAFLPLTVILFAVTSSFGEDATNQQHKATGSTERLITSVQRFFGGIYVDGDPAVVDELASDKISISYPVFKEIYGTYTLQGKDDVKKLCANFTRKLADRHLNVRQVIADGHRAVMVWSFEGRFVDGKSNERPEPVQWTGISVFHFNKDGEIEREYGLECDPGPFSQLLAGELTADSGGNENDVSATAPSQPTGVEASGTISPLGPPAEPPTRVDAGGSCIVDLKKAYTITGALSGSLSVDYRIFVDGPCGSPIGTFDENWIAHGEFRGTVDGKEASSTFSYIAKVKAGGEVSGTIVFGHGLKGKIRVRGNFADGKLSYKGRVEQD